MPTAAPLPTHMMLEDIVTGRIVGRWGTSYADALEYPPQIAASQYDIPAGHYRAHLGVITSSGSFRAMSGKVIKAV